MIKNSLKKNDKQATWIIGIFSFVVFAVIVSLNKIHLHINLGFNPHVFATINAVVNSIVALLLVAALVAVKNKKYQLHKNIMLCALGFSVVFLISYIAHHLLAGDTKFGGEGFARTIYFVILISHIFLAAIILPFILFTAYRALIGEFETHKKWAKITWPLWFYVAITGPIVYAMISPFYK
jgi:putative membrane protein